MVDAETSRLLGEIAALEPVAEIRGWRAAEAKSDALATKEQFRRNRLACIYGRDILVDPMCTGFKVKDPVRGWVRGKISVALPSAAAMRLRVWEEVRVSPEVADGLIARDG